MTQVFLRGSVRGRPLTEHEHNALFARAMTGSRKEAAAMLEISEHAVKHAIAAAFLKLHVEDITEAFWALGWLNPVPYGVNPAEIRHERLIEGLPIR